MAERGRQIAKVRGELMSAGMKKSPVAIPSEIYGDDDLAKLRALSMKERGDLLSLACKAAARILESRRRMGIPDPEPEPWHPSTYEWLKNWTRGDGTR